jgi:hypothetical protein
MLIVDIVTPAWPNGFAMTTEEESGFNRHGCVSRCLIKLTENIHKPVTKDDFCRRFAHLFPNPKTQYGLLDLASIPEIAAALSLPVNVKMSVDYDAILRESNRPQCLVLVFSSVNLFDPGITAFDGHCSVLHEIGTETFSLWTPLLDGREVVLPSLPKAVWVTKKCLGWALS